MATGWWGVLGACPRDPWAKPTAVWWPVGTENSPQALHCSSALPPYLSRRRVRTHALTYNQRPNVSQNTSVEPGWQTLIKTSRLCHRGAGTSAHSQIPPGSQTQETRQPGREATVRVPAGRHWTRPGGLSSDPGQGMAAACTHLPRGLGQPAALQHSGDGPLSSISHEPHSRVDRTHPA